MAHQVAFDMEGLALACYLDPDQFYNREHFEAFLSASGSLVVELFKAIEKRKITKMRDPSMEEDCIYPRTC